MNDLIHNFRLFAAFLVVPTVSWPIEDHTVGTLASKGHHNLAVDLKFDIDDVNFLQTKNLNLCIARRSELTGGGWERLLLPIYHQYIYSTANHTPLPFLFVKTGTPAVGRATGGS
eukprot:6188073-Pleurochrysis_carterae.AAC.3